MPKRFVTAGFAPAIKVGSTQDGYLWLTGRLKELINRGGEKIAPREVDEVLLGHPAVRQAVCFAVAHAQLGEEVGAAIELQPGASTTAAELRAWAGARLPAFKVPRVIRVLDEIPKGPTGKLQRIGLASRLGIEPLDDRRDDADHVAPRSAVEAGIAAIWAELFPGARVGVRTRFEALGGDSLLAVRMLAEVSERLGRDVPYLVFAEDGTIEALASALESLPVSTLSALVALRASGSDAPLYCVPATTAHCTASTASPERCRPHARSGRSTCGTSIARPASRTWPSSASTACSRTTRTALIAWPDCASAGRWPRRSHAGSSRWESGSSFSG